MIEYKCPHCETVLYKTEFATHNIGCPIRTCPHCSKEYNHRYTYEWSIISPFHKFFYCFLASGRFYFLLLIIAIANYRWLNHFTGTIIWILVCLLRFKISDSDNAAESYQRTKDNPEYIKKLSDLGCTSIDIRIDPFYK